MKSFLVTLFVLVFNLVYSQNDRNDPIYFLADKNPEFLHSDLSLGDYIKKEIDYKEITKYYPLETWQDSMTAAGNFSVVTDSIGNTTFIRTINGDILPDISEKIIDALKKCKWKPAEHNGNMVSYKTLLAVKLIIKQADFFIVAKQQVYSKFEGDLQLPEFEDGEDRWMYYLDHSMKLSKLYQKIPYQARNKNYTVEVRFLINPNGEISKPIAVGAAHIPKALVNACIKIISESPKWNPAIKNGIPVPFVYTQLFKWGL
jgi:hypothetical protein